MILMLKAVWSSLMELSDKKITNQNILSISLHLPVVVLVHWVMNVALCLPIMKPFLKKLQDAGDSVGAPMAITALGCL
jgi:hypothetical protein